MGALKKAIFKTFITVVLLGAMSLPVYAYMGAADAAWTYMEGTGEKGTVESPESSVTVWLNPHEGSTAQGAQQTEDASGRETSEPESPFSIPGNGEVLDEIRSSSDKDFYAIQTQNHNTFYLVVDHASSSDNVYMLSTIDEDDLEEFLKEKKETEPEPEPVIIKEPAAEPEEPSELPRTGSCRHHRWVLLFSILQARPGGR